MSQDLSAKEWSLVAPRSRTVAILALVLVAASLLRLHSVITRPYIYDEGSISIPLAKSISFSPGHLNLPIRGVHHPALPSYIVKASGALFGETRVGYRAVHLLTGVFAVFLIYCLTKQWYGPHTAGWAAALLAFNEYHIGVSTFATAKGPHLLFIALAVYAFSRFLLTQRVPYIYAAGAVLSLAFYCKEHSVLLLPVFFLTLMQPMYRHWLGSRHAYLACVLFFLVIAPDIIWDLQAPVATVQAGTNAFHATYGDHLSRIGGIGLTPYPLLFFAHGTIQWLYLKVTGTWLTDNVAENPSMNAVLGLFLLAAVCARTLRSGQQDDHLRGFLLLLFWLVFGFFSSIRPGYANLEMDPVAWYWVDVTLFPAVILSGSVLAGATGRWATLLRSVAVLGMIVASARTSVWWPFMSEN